MSIKNGVATGQEGTGKGTISKVKITKVKGPRPSIEQTLELQSDSHRRYLHGEIKTEGRGPQNTSVARPSVKGGSISLLCQ